LFSFTHLSDKDMKKFAAAQLEVPFGVSVKAFDLSR
jgi:hypothetical protein